MKSQNFLPNISLYNLIQNGEVTCSAPSNIALVKYWGKIEVQIPMNPSISYTLSKCLTTTNIKFERNKTEGLEVLFKLDGKENLIFGERIISFFETILPFIPILQSYKFEINTTNTFPHSSGIASSASGFAAMAMCLVEIEKLLGQQFTNEFTKTKASFIARLGSGSACRSIYSGLVIWGEHYAVKGCNKRYAIAYPYEIQPIFKSFQDTILVVEKKIKNISSTLGHHLMDNNPYKENRINSAQQNLKNLIEIFKNGSVDEFGKLIEHEALSLHAMMLTSSPPFFLINSYTLEIIKKIWQFRKDTNQPLYFTLDAGSSLHLLYPKVNITPIQEFIKTELLTISTDITAIYDEVCFD